MLGVLGADHRVHENVDRDVVDLGERALELSASGAVWIGEHRHDALAIAALHLHGEIERQRFELDGIELAQTVLGQVAFAAKVEDISLDDVASGRIYINHAHAVRGTKTDLVESGY